MKRYEIAIYAMYLLGRGQKVLDMEDIAMKCNEIAPGSFSWRKYKDQINLDVVRSLIKGAKEEKYGSLVSGSAKSGWRLTSAGVDYARALHDSLSNGGTKASQKLHLGVEKRSPSGHLDSIRINKILTRIEESAAYITWNNTKGASNEDLNTLLRIGPYASDQSIQLKLARLATAKGRAGEIDEFIDYVLTKMGDLP